MKFQQLREASLRSVRKCVAAESPNQRLSSTNFPREKPGVTFVVITYWGAELAYATEMPCVLELGPYRFIFFSSDRDEPIHIHVKRDRQIAKFWLNPVVLATNHGFRQHELDRIARLVMQYESILSKAWNDYFDPKE